MDVENIVNDVPIEEPAKDITSTKPKNSKRVEQGQRLAEWNRKNKLQKQKQNDSPKSNSPHSCLIVAFIMTSHILFR